MGDAAHGNLEFACSQSWRKVGVLAMLSVTYLGVTVCFVGIIFWESFLDSFRLWVSELSGWERLGGVEKVSVFWQKGEMSTATLMHAFESPKSHVRDRLSHPKSRDFHKMASP